LSSIALLITVEGGRARARWVVDSLHVPSPFVHQWKIGAEAVIGAQLLCQSRFHSLSVQEMVAETLLRHRLMAAPIDEPAKIAIQL